MESEPLLQPSVNQVTTNTRTLLPIFVGIVLLLLGFAGGFYYGSRSPKDEGPQSNISPSPNEKETGCTLDAKLCSDGTAVGRMPPNCEFAPCPDTTKIPQITDAATSYVVPTNWMKYDKKFQDLQFSFSYPPGLTIYDQDPDSGDIEIRDSKVSVQLLMGRTSLLGFQEYDGGSRREWFLREYKKMFPSEDTGGLSFKEVVFGNNDFLLIQNTRENAMIQSGSDFYLGVFAGKAVRVRDFRTLSKEDVRILLSNLEIK